MNNTDILIIGGGLAGLSAARELQGQADYLLAEKNRSPGGLSGSIEQNGFIFDYSGHLLHLHWKETSELILKLLGGNCLKIKRKALIYLSGVSVDYPFQANLRYLPDKIKSDCVKGFLEAYKKNIACPAVSDTPDRTEVFSNWSQRVFGKGISRHFMLPYNSKLWQYPLDRLTTEWCAPFVPVPTPQEIIESAYKSTKLNLGYNSYFYYPKRGGIQTLPDALARGVKNIMLNKELVSLDMKTRTASFKNSEPVKYKRLINTMPLKEFAGLLKNAPVSIKNAAGKLKHNSVFVLNLGVKGRQDTTHWTYFPEKEFLFYRAGNASNFSKHLAPSGHSALYIEIATPGKPLNLVRAQKEIIKGLLKAGVIRSQNDIVRALWLEIPCAYVIFDKEREPALSKIFKIFSQNDIHSIGRYGAWKYSFMEESIKEGLETARVLLK